MNRFLTLFLLFLLMIGSATFVLADDLSDLSELSDNPTELQSGDQGSNLDALADDTTEGNELSDLSDNMGDGTDSLDTMGDTNNGSVADIGEESRVSIQFGGYLKTLTYMKRDKYSDETWASFQYLKSLGGASPEKQDDEYVSDVGARLQLRLEGYLGRQAKMFTALNIDFNDAAENTTSEETDKNSNNGNLRLVEAFIEMYAGDSVFKVGPQIVTWGFMEGFEVPTDRVNARDYSYNSTEYEDSKLPANAILFQQPIWDAKLELLYIPVAKTNIQPTYSDYYFQGGDNMPEKKTVNAKFGYRLMDNFGDLDWAISYVAMTDPNPDLAFDSNGFYVRKYNQVRSTGLDLQYSFSSWLAKLAYVEYYTKDNQGEDPYTKNDWKKYLIGGEFFIAGNTVNLYVGQTIVDKFEEGDANQQVINALISQPRETTNFISGHVSANFLTGNALNITLLFAGYYDEDNKPVQKNLKLTTTYTIANGLDFMISPSYFEIAKNEFSSLQAEVKYSF